MYCGDGINDIIALAGADVGVAIGASDASAAAEFSDKRNSVAGACTALPCSVGQELAQAHAVVVGMQLCTNMLTVGKRV